KNLGTFLNEFEKPVLRIDKNIQALSKLGEDKRRVKILKWISPLHYEDYHNIARSGYTRDTGLWLFRHSKYKEWRGSSASMVLWLHGIRRFSFWLRFSR